MARYILIGLGAMVLAHIALAVERVVVCEELYQEG
jgi:hypothetical protein